MSAPKLLCRERASHVFVGTCDVRADQTRSIGQLSRGDRHDGLTTVGLMGQVLDLVRSV